MKKFIDLTLDKTADERGELLEANKEIECAHEECAEAGETEMNMETNLHYIALVEHKGYLWKCDGHKPNPKKCMRVNITNKDKILENAAEYALKFMEKNPKVLQFAALAVNKF